VPSERSIEIPWVLSQLPQAGKILDIGSCEAIYLSTIPQYDRFLHCLDPRNCSDSFPPEAIFHNQSILGNDLPPSFFDCVLLVSTIEHIGLPWYDQKPFPDGDHLTLAEVARLLKPDGYLLMTVPAGAGNVATWYRQYSPPDLKKLLARWDYEIIYMGFQGDSYKLIPEDEVANFSYRPSQGAGAVACVKATPL
jgi:SAM-dependent methyltransferase